MYECMTISREELLRRIKSCILEIEPDAEIILYGSQARGDAREESDWDFLILLNHPVARKGMDAIRDKIYTEVEWDAGAVLSSIIRFRQNWQTMSVSPFYQNVMREGTRV